MSEKSLLQLLRENGETGRIPFHMPGHKRNTERFPHLQHFSAAEDITEIDGFDNLHGARVFWRRPCAVPRNSGTVTARIF